MAEGRCVVVGGGLIGALFARKLAESGRAVVLVERGRPVTTPPGSHVRNAPPLRDDPDAYFAGIDPLFDYLDRDVGPGGLPGAFTTAVDGGMGIAWTNNCPRAVDGVDRPRVLDDTNWDRCYQAAEHALWVSDDQFEDSRRGTFAQDRLGARLAADGRDLQPLPLAGRREGPQRIHFVGPADVLAGVTGIERRRATVEALELRAGRVRGVRVDGEVLPADTVVVAAGAIETPALLARSGVRSAALGRYLSFHPVLIGQVVLDLPSPAASSGPDPLPRLGVPPTEDHPWFTMVLRDTNPLVPVDDDVEPDRLLEIQAFAPVDNDASNRLLVDEKRGPRFDVPLSADDEARRVAMAADVDGLCRELGRWRRGCEAQWAPLGTPHLMGTSRMGTDPATSVVDKSGAVWGVEGLYLAGNAVIPTRLAVNPTLTAAALAIHTAEGLVAGQDAPGA